MRCKICDARDCKTNRVGVNYRYPDLCDQCAFSVQDSLLDFPEEIDKNGRKRV